MPTPRTVTTWLAAHEWAATLIATATAAPLGYWRPWAGVAAVGAYFAARAAAAFRRANRFILTPPANRRPAHRAPRRPNINAEAALARVAAVRTIAQRRTRKGLGRPARD